MIPAHVGYIMDGNGRWAESRGLPRSAGYAEGLKAMLRVLRRTEERGVRVATVYAFSSENFARPEEESSAIADVVERWNRSYDGGWKVTYMGELSRFSERLRESVALVVGRTAENEGLRLNIALGYGGHEDIVNAARRAAAKGEIDSASFENCLSSAGLPPLDLIVRSGGEKRLSGFMLYEAAYSELYFTDALWPDMTEKDVDDALGEFARRTRKFGA